MAINMFKCIIKKIFGFCLGIMLALGFYYGILVDMGLDENVLKYLGLSLCCLLGLGCFFSAELQCVGLICVTMFCSSNGRRTLQGMIFAYLIAGPGQNIINNGQEVARTFGCSAELTYNLTKQYTNLVVAPFKQAIMGMKESDAESVSAALQAMEKQISPLKKELSGDDSQEKQLKQESDYVDLMQGNSLRSSETEEKYTAHLNEMETEGQELEKKYMKNLEIKCQGILSRSTERCREGFGTAYENCENKVSTWVSWLVCWPMKLTVVCEIITLLAGDKACDATDNVEPGYGASISSLSRAEQVMGKQMGKTHFHFHVPKPDIRLNIQDAASSVRNVMADVKVKIDAAEIILLTMRRLLVLLFLPIILESVQYVNSYLVHPDHDNNYITSYFKKIDERRCAEGRHPTLLPLKQEERSKFINIKRLTPNGPETKTIFGPYLRLVMLCLIAGVMLSTDHILAKTLSIVAKHGRTNITQKGHHTVHIIVKGSGFVAKMVRSMVQGFNEDKDVNNVFTNEKCLPHPKMLDPYYLRKIGLAFFAMASLVLVDHFPTRMRRLICAAFYPKREKQRTLHLYNAMLKSRSLWYINMRDRLRLKAKELCQKSAMQFPLPAPLRWLWTRVCRVLPRAKRTCALCGDKESKSRDFKSCCRCPRGIDFCPQCWADVEEACPACSVKIE